MVGVVDCFVFKLGLDFGLAIPVSWEAKRKPAAPCNRFYLDGLDYLAARMLYTVDFHNPSSAVIVWTLEPAA